MKKAMIAMSGGVDSSVAAHLTQQQGYACIGATLQLCSSTLLGLPADSPCCSLKNAEDAKSVADRLGIDFYVFDARDIFRQQVVDRFVKCYEEGGTPNPCVDCNRNIKFSDLLERSLTLGCEKLVTGHYAKISRDEVSGRYLLKKAVDTAKDQSYFLACLTQHQLSHCLFPLGELTKEQVRAIAQEQGFITAKKKDSQDICFIPDGDYVSFIRRYTGKAYPAGDYLNSEGRPVGRHSGAICYTVGQRKGLGIALGEPVYVCSKDMENNTVTVGPDSALYADTLLADNWNWISIPALTEPIRVKARIRYRHTEQPATVYPEENGIARVVFDEPQRAITPGQAVVLYDGDTVVGSGTIQ